MTKLATTTLRALHLLVFLPLLSAGCTKKDKNTLNVAWIGPLTGPVSLLGVDSKQAIELAFSQYNALRKNTEPEINFGAVDDQYDAKKTEEAYLNVNLQHPTKFYFMSTYDAYTRLSDRVSADGSIIINSLDNDQYLSGLNSQYYLMAKRTEQLAEIIAKAIIQDKRKNTLILFYKDDSFMPTLAYAVRNFLEQNKNKIVLLPYAKDTKKPSDFARLLKSNPTFKPDSYVVLGYAELAHALQTLSQTRSNKAIYSVSTILALAGDKKIQDILQGSKIAYFSLADAEAKKTTEFMEAYNAKFGANPKIDWVALQAYDAANLFLEGVKRTAKSIETRDLTAFSKEFSKPILSVSSFSGLTGNLSLNPDRTTQGTFFSLYELDRGLPRKVKNSKNDLGVPNDVK